LEIDLKRIRELAKLLHQFDLSEVEVSDRQLRVRLRRELSTDGAPVVSSRRAAARRAAPPAAPDAPAEETAAAEDANTFFVTSPFVGTFYGSPSPESPPYVEVGQTVVAGQVLCIVEAMKLMNEIEADQPGRVVEILAEAGKSVEYGQRLFRMQRA